MRCSLEKGFKRSILGGGEIKEEISEAEKRFDFYRKTVSLFLGPFVFLALLITPMPELSAEAHRLCAIMGLVLIFWVGEPIPIPATALLGPALCVIFAVAKSSVVFAPFSNPIIFLFIGSFMLAEAMKTHHLDRRLALTILSLPMVGNNLYCVMFAVAIIPLVLSMWISDSAATAMMYPIMLGVLSTIDRLGNSTEAPNGLIDPQTATKKRKFGAGALLTIAYAAVIGGIGTPIGTPPNLIGIAMVNKMIGVNISFFSWMSLAVPIMIVMAFFMLLYMSFVFPPLSSEIKGLSQVILKEKSALGSWTRGQKNTLAAFFFAIVLWILPGISAAILGTGSEVYKFLDTHIHEEIVSLIAALGLFFAPVNWSERKFTITWAEAVKIDWGTILLFGGGLSLGTLMFSTKLADFVGSTLIKLTGVSTLWEITAMSIVLAIIATELTSNTAAANMLVPLAISVAKTAGVSGIPPAIGVCLGASMAFMLPVSTPSNAIVYGSGKVPITCMIKAGIILDTISFFVIFSGLRILCPLVGLL